MLAFLWGCGGSDGDAPPPGPAVTYNLQVISDDPNQDLTPFRNEDANAQSAFNDPAAGAFVVSGWFPMTRADRYRTLTLWLPPEASFEPSRVFEVNQNVPKVDVYVAVYPMPYESGDPISAWGGPTGTVSCIERVGRTCRYRIDWTVQVSDAPGFPVTMRGDLVVDYSRIE